VRRLDLKKAQAARLGTIRDINRQIVLNYVREREPISRAEIARETELQRSTVSAIVDCLIGEGLVEEIGAGESTGGRRPTLLRLRTAGAIAIGVALTPSSTTIATSDLAGRVLRQQSFKLEEQGLIQAFEFTHELAWNTLKDFLEGRGVQNLYGSKDVTRAAFTAELIENGQAWMDMISSRNLTSHAYDEATAAQIVSAIRNTYVAEFEVLRLKLEQLGQEAQQ